LSRTVINKARVFRVTALSTDSLSHKQALADTAHYVLTTA